MSAKVVAFINFKGGVGKTANAVNIGAALAQFHEKRVLIVDLDAQCNASLWLLDKPAWRAHTEDLRRTVYQLFRDHISRTDKFDFNNAVIRGVPRNEEGFPALNNLDLLPAAVELIEIEDKIGRKNTDENFRYLAESLKPALRQYDYILLDCPPNIYSVSRNALFFADDLVIPYIPDFLSLSGFQIFAGLVEQHQESIASHRGGRKRARISAVVVNRYQRGNVYDEGITELNMLVARLKEDRLIDERAAIIEPPIRSCVKVAASPDFHLPVTIFAPGSIGATDYVDVTQNLLAHFES